MRYLTELLSSGFVSFHLLNVTGAAETLLGRQKERNLHYLAVTSHVDDDLTEKVISTSHHEAEEPRTCALRTR